jgi:predicted enzyme related to lactoylglutathione lyase
MAAPFGKLAYLYVGTSDFERDLAYYTDVLGAEVIWNRQAFGARVASLRLCKGPQYLLADHRPAPSCLPIFEVPNLKATSRQLRSRGWKSEGRSFEIPPGPCVLFKDPSGNELALFENLRPNVMGEDFED